MSSFYGDDYYMEYSVDPLVKSTSSRLYSLDIYMDQGMVYYTRSYKKLFLIISDFFPILKFILFIIKNCTQHFKMSSTRRRLAGLIFENVSLKKKKIERSSYSSLYPAGNKLIETNNNSKKELKIKNITNEGNNSYAENQASNNEFFMNINKHRNNLKSINNFNFFGNSHSLKNKDSDSDIIKNNASNNKSNMSLNNENIIQILNKQAITNLNSQNRKSMILLNSKIKDTYNTKKKHYKRNKKELKGEKKKELFPYLYFFLDFFFDKFKLPKKFCGISKRYFTLYNFMGQIYDISTHILLLKKFNILNNFILENVNSANNPFEKETKININDKNKLSKLNIEIRKLNCIVFTNSILRH
jgi:hypothetical protein